MRMQALRPAPPAPGPQALDPQGNENRASLPVAMPTSTDARAPGTD